MNCLKENCHGELKESDFNDINGFKSYRCKKCNSLFDEKDLKKNNSRKKEYNPWVKQEGESEEDYIKRLREITPYF